MLDYRIRLARFFGKLSYKLSRSAYRDGQEAIDHVKEFVSFHPQCTLNSHLRGMTNTETGHHGTVLAVSLSTPFQKAEIALDRTCAIALASSILESVYTENILSILHEDAVRTIPTLEELIKLRDTKANVVAMPVRGA